MLYPRVSKRRWTVRFAAMVAAAMLGGSILAGQARADEVVLKNGDTIHGAIGEIAAGVMKFTSPNLGALSIKLSDIKSYKTEKPAVLQLKQGQQQISSPITEGTAEKITTADGQTLPTAEVKYVNHPKPAWTGSIIASGVLNRGNTNNETGGIAANANLRRETPELNDRIALGADYNFGNTGRGSNQTETTDNGDLRGEYDRYFSDQFYGLAVAGLTHDRIAHLNYRLTPGLGIGYQPFESPAFNLRGEAGVSYLYEDFSPGGVDSKVALRLAYHVDKQLNDRVSVFNDVEWLPAFENPADYVLNADAGFHADITKQFFGELKVVYRRNDNPPAGTLKDDLAFIAGLGWKF
jgi:putative salt-induced outer membrane protein YdiY